MKNDFAETLDAIKDAYQEGYKNATEKAFEFIKENIDRYTYRTYDIGKGYEVTALDDDFEEDFKNYMKGE